MGSLVHTLGLRLPIIQAPMYGVSTPSLVAKVAKYGALGSFGAGVLPPDVLRQSLDNLVRLVPDKRFNVNLFVESTHPSSSFDTDANWHAFEELLAPVRAAVGVDPTPRAVDRTPAPSSSYLLDAHVALVQEFRPSVVSFCFGVLDRAVIRECQAFAHVIGTATSVEEAIALEEAGVDAIVAQGRVVLCRSRRLTLLFSVGGEAGGHRGTFLELSANDAQIGTLVLVPQICDAVRVPVIAAGGITDARHVTAALALGADAVQVGSAFVGTPESAASPAWKASLGTHHASTATTVTRGLTGRHARMLRNDLVDRLQPHEAWAASSPRQRRRMADIIQQKDGRFSALLVGQGHRACENGASVHDVLARLVGRPLEA
ncbi:Aste57867_5969 [Aphanomyces stellatus]|uniref:Aste57867_5969 protein n=1 Tax=Aphanomyces stellatus TaxID=120398 RepID=A0A485KHN9_9STRA|nr:hypothetical protein As57867_005955 [Aphanomyces stellatus]VFT82986.1 Aste57867_5969 [Aphanomyces stellatus]